MSIYSEQFKSGKNLFTIDYLQGVFAHLGDVTNSMRNDTYSYLYYTYVSDDFEYLHNKHSNLFIVALFCTVKTSDHSKNNSESTNIHNISTKYKLYI